MTEDPGYADADEYGARVFAYLMGKADREVRNRERYQMAPGAAA
ncbi:hypothetical protein [Streptomyces sp. NBC_01304]|nr:hypothetical protein OG430_47880 [Streptomyces sp. NBC_01304]